MMWKGGDDVRGVQGPFLSTKYRPHFSAFSCSTSRKSYHEFGNIGGHGMMNRPRRLFVRPPVEILNDFNFELCNYHF